VETRNITVMANAHRIVWAYREKLSADWPTPDPLDSTRFAVTEAGEATADMLETALTFGRPGDASPILPFDPRACARVAWACAAAALDAQLRQNPKYNRNNQRVVSAADEWADCAIMVATALGGAFGSIADDIAEGRLKTLPYTARTSAGVSLVLATAMWLQEEHPFHERDGHFEWELWLWVALDGICSMVGSDLPGLVEERLNRIETRIKAKKQAEQAQGESMRRFVANK